MKTSFLVNLGICALTGVAAQGPASTSWAQVPHYEVDAAWPKPLPDRWVMGGLGGVCVDAQDHVLILNRQDIVEGELNAGRLAPPLIELDPAGKVVNSWGDPKLLDDPIKAPPRAASPMTRLHSCHFDKDNNVWIASSPSGMISEIYP